MAPESDSHRPWRAPEGAPPIRKITISDLLAALAEGWADFRRYWRFDLVFSLVYVLGGWLIVLVTRDDALRGWMFPLIAGFALIGPFAAVAFYDISRRHDLGQSVTWAGITDVMKGASRRSIMMLGFVLMFALAVWSRVAVIIYAIFYGLQGVDFMTLLTEIVTTPRGLTFFIVGNAVGAVFALVVFSISALSFPFLLDRDADFVTGMITSLKAVATNPGVMLVWGMIVAALLMLATLPAFLGLLIVLPVLGHATWRLYRKAAVS